MPRSPDLRKQRVLELNASDERGIKVIREKVKNFAQSAVGQRSEYACLRRFLVTRGAGGYPSPPYKIIVLDEADAMTTDAQSALRRIMENYSRVTRFCLICNYASRIIEPLKSRCARFRFKPLDHASCKARIQHIATEEKLDIADEVIIFHVKADLTHFRPSTPCCRSQKEICEKPSCICKAWPSSL